MKSLKTFGVDELYEYFRSYEYNQRKGTFDDNIYEQLSEVYSQGNGTLKNDLISQFISEKIVMLEIGELVYNNPKLYKKFQKDYYDQLYSIFLDNLEYYFWGNGSKKTYEIMFDFIIPMLGKYISNIKELRDCVFSTNSIQQDENNTKDIKGSLNLCEQVFSSLEMYSKTLEFDVKYVALRNNILFPSKQ